MFDIMKMYLEMNNILLQESCNQLLRIIHHRVLIFKKEIVFILTFGVLSATTYAQNPGPNYHFDLAKWKGLMLTEYIELKKNKHCLDNEAYFDRMIKSIKYAVPICDSLDIQQAYFSLDKKPGKNARLCLLTMEDFKEGTLLECLVFWLDGNKCKGVYWEDSKLKVLKRSAKDYYKIKKMSTICSEHLTSFGQITFTEIWGENMAVKAVLFPSAKQEEKIRSFIYKH